MWRLAAVFASLATLVTTSAQAARTLQNGSFETGNLKGWYVLTGDFIQVQGASVQGISAYKGTHWVSQGRGINVLAQDITATAGQKFKLSFAVANHTAGTPSNTFVVEWCHSDGNGCIPFANTTFNGVSSFPWKKKVNVVTSDGTNKLEVSAFIQSDGDFWAVDDFRLTPVSTGSTSARKK